MKYAVFLGAFLLPIFTTQAFGQEELRRAYDSSCLLQTSYIKDGRVWTKTFSGAVFYESPEHYFVLTCGHGLSPLNVGDPLRCWFFVGAKTSEFYNAKIARYLYDAEVHKDDIGFVSIEKKYVKSPRPKATNLGLFGLKENDYVITLGRPQGDGFFPTAYLGQITDPIGYSGLFQFRPQGLSGRSGSPVFKDGELIGMLLRGGNGRAFALTAKDIHYNWNRFIDVRRKQQQR